MMPAPSDYGSKRVHVDANAVIDYIREYTLDKMKMAHTSPKMAIFMRRLGQIRPVYITATARREADHNLRKDLVHKLRRSRADKLTGRAYNYLRKYCDKMKCEEIYDFIPAARAMYASISSDLDNQKFFKWKEKKGKHVADPVIGSDFNDLLILSTAASDAQQHAVELWTHDTDFTMFGAEILSKLGVQVVDTHRL